MPKNIWKPLPFIFCLKRDALRFGEHLYTRHLVFFGVREGDGKA